MSIIRIFQVATATFLTAILTVSAAGASFSYNTKDGRTVDVTAVTPYIIRVDNYPSGSSPVPVQSVLELKPNPSAGTVSRLGTSLVTTGGVQAIYNPASGSLMLRSNIPGSLVVDDGTRRLGKDHNELRLATAGSGSFYGAGERGHKLNLRGDTLVMYNRQNYGYTGKDPRISQMNITMPLFLSNDGYAVVFDDFAAAKMIMGRTIKYISESDKPITYYYIGACANMADLTEQLTELTGRQSLPPFWALGYISSKYGYRTQQETLGVIDTLKQHGYPVDGIVLDLYWYGKEQDMGRLAWDPVHWPEPEKMLGKLKDEGVKLVAISQPYVLRNGRGVDNYNELAAKDLLVKDSVAAGPQEVKIWVGEGGMFDVSNPLTRRWLGERYKQLTDKGITGWWGDLGEPEVHPEKAMHSNGLSARLYHNRYGNDWASVIRELYEKEYPGTRLMTLMRGGTTGLQRENVFPWSTDVSRSWGGLEPQVRIMLHSGLSGLGYMSSDLGGFAVEEGKEYQPELYVRWLQTGLFSPVFRTHAQKFAEPYCYPQYEALILDMVKERYRWLPYNYTLAYENAEYGWPLVRPLDFTDNARGAFDRISDQYLWGSEVLVAPVMKQAVKRSITFPAGSVWYDYSNPSLKFEGGSRVRDYEAPLEKLPLFVREGAFIPLATYEMNNTGDYRSDDFTIRYYPGTAAESSYTLYDDDRISTSNISDGQYRLITFAGSTVDGRTTVTVSSEGTYAGAPANVSLGFEVFTLDAAPAEVKVNGHKTDFTFDAGVLAFRADYRAGSKCVISIKR